MEWDGGFGSGGGSHEEEKKRDPVQDYIDAWKRRQEEIDRKSPGTGWGGNNPVPARNPEEYGGGDNGGGDHHDDGGYHKPEEPVYGQDEGGGEEEHWDAPKKPAEPVYTAPETTAEATDLSDTGQKTGQPKQSEPETIVYTGPATTGGKGSGPAASGTKDALTEEEEKQPDWMTYGAGTGRRSGEERAEQAAPKTAPKPASSAGTTPSSVAGSGQMSVADAMGISGIKGRGIPKLTPQTPATPTPAVGSPSGQMTVEDAKAIQGKKGGGIPGYVPPANNGYVPPSGLRENPPAQSTENNNVPSNGYVPTNYLRENPETSQNPSEASAAGTAVEAQHTSESPNTSTQESSQESGRRYDPEYQNALAVLNRQGIYGEEAVRQAEQIAEETKKVKDDVYNWFHPDESWVEAYGASKRAGYDYNPPETATSTQITDTKEPRKSAYDLDAVMGSGEMVYDPASGDFVYQGKPNTPPAASGTTGPSPKPTSSAGSGSGSGSGSGTGTGTGTGTGSGNGYSAGKEYGTGSGSGTVPPGSQYFRPSYGQEMEKGVKAPYRKGGYTEEELRAMGNVEAGKDRRHPGMNFYEGYYIAPDLHYYPVDQIKANYYNRYGTYNGWQEGMRDYWNTFGTFYGYRPGWQSGRGGGGRRYYGGGGGASYGRGGSSSGGSGNSNGGIYWNPNTSWSI